MLRKIISIVLVVIIAALGFNVPSKAEAAVSPVVLKDIQYAFNDNVRFIDLSGMTRAGDHIRVPNVSVNAGDILVDKGIKASLKVLKVNDDGSLVTVKPTMTDLFKEFKIPRQVIEPTSANITEYAVKGISVEEYAASLKKQESPQSGGQKVMSGSMPGLMDKIQTIFANRGTKIYQYNGEYEFSPFGSFSGNKVKLALDGEMGVSPGLVAEYSLFGGYEFGFVDAAQFIKLNMMFDVQLKEEVYLPVFSVGVSIADLGSIRLGIYLVVDVDGDITLTVKAEEGIIANASVYGGTSFGIPTSFHTNTGFEKYFGAECDPMGYVNAGLYITPLVSLEILDVDVFDAQLRLGFYGYANITEDTMKYGVDFVINAFVIILDDKTDLINEHIPIIERNKSFRLQDDVIFYFSRLCVYQDRINIAAMTKRLSGSTPPNAPPFSDKLPFSNRMLEIWYYKAGNDPQGGNNPNPDYKIPVMTDIKGCVGIDFKALKGQGYPYGIDVSKGDVIKIKAPGFMGETQLIKSVSPFGTEKLPGQSDFYGSSKITGDFFEDTVEFNTLSGRDLTGLDVPNTEGIEFVPDKRIWYNGPVKVYATDKTTGVTETAVFTAREHESQFTLYKPGYITMVNSDLGKYNIKPNNELRWQINLDGFIYGTYEPTGAGGPETTHKVSVRRLVEDNQVVIENYYGKPIGIQHNVTLHVIAVNKGGTKPYKGSAKLSYVLGKVPAGYVQSVEVDKAIMDLGYIKFPAANVRYPNHYEYYVYPPFPQVLYTKNDAPDLQVDPANNIASTTVDSDGTVSQAHYYWKWQELQPDTPERVSITRTTTSMSPTGAPITRTETLDVSNIKYNLPAKLSLSEFISVPNAYTVYDPMAGKSIGTDDAQNQPRDVYQMRHIVSGMTIEGVKIDDPPFSPPNPTEKGDLSGFTPGDPKAFDIEFQLELMKNHSDRFVVNPLEQSKEQYKTMPAVMKNTSVKPGAAIKNLSALPQWAKDYIGATVNNGIMTLDSTGNFPAGKFTTRAEFSAAIVNALGLTAADTQKTGFPFIDVNSKDKNLSGMKIAYQCGIISGTSAKTFAPMALITRQDAATMIMRAFKLRNSSLIPTGTEGKINGFTDKAMVSRYSITGLEQAIGLGFFSGYPNGTLMPKNNITNEQTAKILWGLKLKAEKPGLQWSQKS